MLRIILFSSIRWKNRAGAAMLPVVLVLGGLILEVAVASSFVAYSVNQLGFGEKLSGEALSAARSGAMDAVQRIIRNKDFYDTAGYVVTIGNRSTTVTVTKDFPEIGQTRIIATGTALMRQKRIQADVSVDAITGEVKVISFEEVNL